MASLKDYGVDGLGHIRRAFPRIELRSYKHDGWGYVIYAVGPDRAEIRLGEAYHGWNAVAWMAGLERAGFEITHPEPRRCREIECDHCHDASSPLLRYERERLAWWPIP